MAAPKPLAAFLDLYPKESILIGQMVVGYGTLEYKVSTCLEEAVNEDAQRAFYRLRGEDHRLNIADAMCRPAYAKIKLEHDWAHTLDATKWCKMIRNQYAHSTWASVDRWGRPSDRPHKNGLRFMVFEDAAKKAEPMTMIEARQVTLLLLLEQHAFFRNVSLRLAGLRRLMAEPDASPKLPLHPRMEKPRPYIDLTKSDRRS